jgi:hypothetical protein
MRRLCFITTAVAIVSTAGVALAQTPPAGGTAPAAAAAGTAAAPAATAPAATAPAATTAPADKPAEPKKEASEPKKKKTAAKKETRQQEIDRSVEKGTVPGRYRSQIPKQYHQYIPFDR